MYMYLNCYAYQNLKLTMVFTCTFNIIYLPDLKFDIWQMKFGKT